MKKKILLSFVVLLCTTFSFAQTETSGKNFELHVDGSTFSTSKSKSINQFGLQTNITFNFTPQLYTLAHIEGLHTLFV